jgi:hypothetical protein
MTDELRTWEVVVAEHGSDHMFGLLSGGWEPFAVTTYPVENGRDFVWLRVSQLEPTENANSDR